MQSKRENGEHVSTSSIYEALTKGSKTPISNASSSSSVPAKKPRLDENVNEESSRMESVEKLGEESFDLPMDMTLNKSAVKQEPMEMAGSSSSGYHSYPPGPGSLVAGFDVPESGKNTYNSPGEVAMGTSTPESGIFDMSSPREPDPLGAAPDRKRSFDATQQVPAAKCNGSYAPRKMLIARSRKTHLCRSSSTESLSSLEGASFSSSLPPRPIGSLAGSPISEIPSEMESPLAQTSLALDMSSRCSMVAPAASPSTVSDVSGTSSPTQMGVLHRKSGSPTCCSHCNIEWNCLVLFTVHMGCHDNTGPFVCSKCKRDHGNQYNFNTHILNCTQ